MLGLDLDLSAVRAMVAISEEGQFGLAAAVLGISQQAVSKRIAKLESQLGVPLFERRIGNAALTAHGARFLPHARSTLATADAAIAAVRDSRILRVAVHGAQIADANLMRFYLEKHPDADIELIMMGPSTTSRDAVIDGRVDVAFARGHWRARPLPAHVTAVPAYLDALHLLVGKGHPLADRDHVKFGELGAWTAWVPGAGFGSEVSDFYSRLSDSCGITITTERHPGGIGFANVVDRVADSTTLVTFGGEGTTTPWHPNIRRIPIVDPTPAYPMALLWREPTAAHPQLSPLIDYISGCYNRDAVGAMWIPEPDRALFTR
ncbi:LysR family transcriptional regulator [Nocardia goodfellowii]|uniref:DNA-binding transcriptional LysR family regulator n=1 Tax=Nocardia goodfellowii TaxID=882446 RepID=A0ABS4QL35_9NOCA|nr:LysR family transcriptional regulator [Nocardia goodfellowii]MBP2192419.1 DNA-binding transcriptional LysR family regulator [Nocardia goodfellowii]